MYYIFPTQKICQSHLPVTSSCNDHSLVTCCSYVVVFNLKAFNNLLAYVFMSVYARTFVLSVFIKLLYQVPFFHLMRYAWTHQS